MIKLEDCKDGYLYEIDARNASYGIFDEKEKGFWINRTGPFGTDNYLFLEEHWDYYEDGTAKPLRKIEKVECFIRNEDTGELGPISEWKMMEYLHRYEYD